MGLKKVRASEGPSPVQDGPRDGTAAAADAFGYLDVMGPTYDYLEHFRQDRFLTEGHNQVGLSRGRFVPERRPADQVEPAPPARSTRTVRPGADPLRFNPARARIEQTGFNPAVSRRSALGVDVATERQTAATDVLRRVRRRGRARDSAVPLDDLRPAVGRPRLSDFR